MLGIFLDKKCISCLYYLHLKIDITDVGMATSSGVFLEDKQDNDNMMYIVNAAVEADYERTKGGQGSRSSSNIDRYPCYPCSLTL